jgi:hypothetical protein
MAAMCYVIVPSEWGKNENRGEDIDKQRDLEETYSKKYQRKDHYVKKS